MSDDILPPVWRDLQSYRAAHGLESPWAWLGVSPRVRSDRLARLVRSKHAVRAIDRLSALSPEELRRVERIATVNAHRAESAFRSVLVVNGTTPVAFFFGIAQIFPEVAQRVAENVANDRPYAMAFVAWAVILTPFLLHAWQRMRDAADLRDLVQIVAARTP